jgi:hypothetical protein
MKREALHENALEFVTLQMEKAEFEEQHKNTEKARSIYSDLYEHRAQSYIKLIIAYVNFECRQANFDKAGQIFEATFRKF